jgi:hypothetical protein
MEDSTPYRLDNAIQSYVQGYNDKWAKTLYNTSLHYKLKGLKQDIETLKRLKPLCERFYKQLQQFKQVNLCAHSLNESLTKLPALHDTQGALLCRILQETCQLLGQTFGRLSDNTPTCDEIIKNIETSYNENRDTLVRLRKSAMLDFIGMFSRYRYLRRSMLTEKDDDDKKKLLSLIFEAYQRHIFRSIVVLDCYTVTMAFKSIEVGLEFET